MSGAFAYFYFKYERVDRRMAGGIFNAAKVYGRSSRVAVASWIRRKLRRTARRTAQ